VHAKRQVAERTGRPYPHEMEGDTLAGTFLIVGLSVQSLRASGVFWMGLLPP